MNSQSSDNVIPSGAARATTPWGEYNRIAFAIQQALAKMQTATLVRIVAVTNAGGVTPVGFVDVVPMVNQVDAAGTPTPHVTIFNVPYLRMQGGTDAIILDPKVGDMGLAVFASRDITKIKSTKRSGNPGSFRQYSFADALYIGGMLNGTPVQYVQFSAAGINITSPTNVTLTAPVVDIDAGESCTVTTPTFTVNGATVLNGTISQTGGGAAQFSGDINAIGDVTADGISLHNHTHPDAHGGNTGAPQ